MIVDRQRSSVWFCSNVGGGVFGGSQTEAWRALGFDARLHSGVDLQTYWRAKSGVRSRLRLRWAMYIQYPWRLYRLVRRAAGAETFIAVTNPFFLPALTAYAARNNKGVRVVNLIFDLYPDALMIGGNWSRSHPLAKLAARSTRRAISKCAGTVYLGERLRRHAEAEYGVARNTAVIAVGTDTTAFRDDPPVARPSGRVRCLYSGHMGRLHDWRTLAGSLADGVPLGMEIEIAADGPSAVLLRQELAHLAGGSGSRLAFAGTRDSAAWRVAMLAADVALVTMRHGAERVVMPSKTYSAMAAGQAILAICPRNSDLADLVQSHNCGWHVEPNDVAGLRSRLAILAASPLELMQKRKNAWDAAHAYYSMEAVGRQWMDWLATLDGK